MALRKITVVPHNPIWERLFTDEAAHLSTVFGREALAITHIGSTSIPGIYAKPIIDIMVVVPEIHRVDALSHMMVSLGYRPKGENGLAGRRFFTKGGDSERKFNVHTFQTGHPEINRCLDFRDYLQTHELEARTYSALKQALAADYPHDIDGYMAGKDAFIKKTIDRARAWRERKLPAEASI
jgi:GrpB-like predicted nucleotidyltransferase (UPF0157 family)